MECVHKEEAPFLLLGCCFSPVSKVSALCCAGGEQNLILLDRTTHKPNTTGTVGWAGSTFGPLHKSRIGEHEFEALMRTLDNLVNKRVHEQGPLNLG